MYGGESTVPYNPYSLTKYNCHINVELCGMISSVQYLYKYVYKGSDRAVINIGPENQVDEISQHLDVRYVCAPEAMHRIQGCDMQRKSHTILRLAVHLPDEQDKEGREKKAVDNAARKFNTLTAYFRLMETISAEPSTFRRFRGCSRPPLLPNTRIFSFRNKKRVDKTDSRRL